MKNTFSNAVDTQPAILVQKASNKGDSFQGDSSSNKVDGSQEKDSVNGKSSPPDVSCKKNFQYLQANTCVGVF